jgi:prepilin-type N-terminal cleavage/methylation domain-containing protein
MLQGRYQSNNMKRGFTLIEMVVSIGIFLIIIVIGMTAILGTISANRKAQASTLVLSNLSLAIEAMTKNLRLAYVPSNANTTYTIGPGGTSIQIIPSSGTGSLTYSLSSGAIARNLNGTVGNITAPEVTIDSLTFTAVDPANGTAQPKVLIRLVGHVGVKATTKTTFYIQSLVSRRVLP